MSGQALQALITLAQHGQEVDVYRPIGADFHNIWLCPTLAEGDRIHPGWRIPDEEWQAHWPMYLRLAEGGVVSASSKGEIL